MDRVPRKRAPGRSISGRSPARKSPARDKNQSSKSTKIQSTSSTASLSSSSSSSSNIPTTTTTDSTTVPNIKTSPVTVNIQQLKTNDTHRTNVSPRKSIASVISSSPTPSKLLFTGGSASTSTFSQSTSTVTKMNVIRSGRLSTQDDSEVERLTSKILSHMVDHPMDHQQRLSKSSSVVTGTQRTSMSRSKSRSYIDDKNNSENSDDDYYSGKNIRYEPMPVSELPPRELPPLEQEREALEQQREREELEQRKRFAIYSSKYSRAANSRRAIQQCYGSTGACIIILLTVAVCFLTQYQCNKSIGGDCSMSKFEWRPLLNITTYFNLTAAGIYFLYIWLIYILGMFSLKSKVIRSENLEGRVCEYYFNGFRIALIVGGIGLVIANVWKVPIIHWVHDNYLQILTISIVHTFIISIWCYFRSKYVPSYLWNRYAKSGRPISDFFLGREINPRWFNVINIKLMHYRIAILTTFFISVCYLLKSVSVQSLALEVIPKVCDVDVGFDNRVTIVKEFVGNLTRWDIAPLIPAGFICIYALELLINEYQMTTSFDVQREGVGALLLLRYGTFPFLNTLIVKYTYEYIDINTEISSSLLRKVSFLALVIFIIGIVMKSTSQALKHKFRIHPVESDNDNVQYISTYDGRGILHSKWWAVVRNPNHLGEILINISFMCLLSSRFAWPPFIAILFTIIYIMCRTKRVNSFSAEHYETVWPHYCNEVPYMLIPRVF